MPIIKPERWTPKGVASLEPAAHNAIRENDRNLCVVASAGAGKTEFLAQKADYLLSTGICRAPHRILAISFKSDAAKNLKERVRQRCGSELSGRFNSLTFDAFSKGIVDRFGTLIPAPYNPSPDYEIVFPGFRDWNDFLARHGYRHLSGETLEQAVARCRLPIATLSPKNPEWKDVLTRFWTEYYQDKNLTRLTFPMINRLVNYVLSCDPRLVAGLQATYPFVFLDEFQDTTFGQYDLLKRLFLSSDACLTAVGDNKQRIMVWAGAMPDAFKTFAGDFNAKQETLISNWRSHPELVEIQHAIAVSLEAASAKPDAKRVKSVDGEVCAIWAYDDRASECEGVASWISEAISSGEMSPEDCAVLVRFKPDVLEEELGPALATRDVRLRNIARSPKGGNIAIQDVLTEDITQCTMALIRLAALQKAPDDWSAIIDRLSLIWGLDPDNEADQGNLQDQVGEKILVLRRFMKANTPSDASCVALVQSILKFVGEAKLRGTVPTYRRDKDYFRARTGLECLLKESAVGETNWAVVAGNFDGVGQVPLMSIHKSKGLEFHTVIFFGLDSGTWWTFKPKDSEEMRAFFVAFTRAMQRVFFTSCRVRGNRIAYVDDLIANAGVDRIPGPTPD
ncbi:UvrD-helicase domain-containing protein [Pseudovibrio denitrificans]|uniref:UvrD-helicase domain-containing protein n=1 Tax=Pseudovibrio denitrificans TaxID=258256 RepID=UPI0039BFD458